MTCGSIGNSSPQDWDYRISNKNKKAVNSAPLLGLEGYTCLDKRQDQWEFFRLDPKHRPNRQHLPIQTASVSHRQKDSRIHEKVRTQIVRASMRHAGRADHHNTLSRNILEIVIIRFSGFKSPVHRFQFVFPSIWNNPGCV